jgi:hypothetical protein
MSEDAPLLAIGSDTVNRAINLEAAYEGGSQLGDCSKFIEEFNQIPAKERLATLVSLSTVNNVRRATRSNVPEVVVEDSGSGGIDFKFPGCEKKR